MSLLEMQRALCHVLTDQQVRDAYLMDPGSALGIFDLSEQEKTCLLSLDRGRLQRYSQMLLATRLDLAFKALPRIRKCFFSEFIAVFAEEYGKKFPPIPVPDRSPMLKEVSFVRDFLYQLIASRRITIPAFENVLRYELTMFFLANEPAVNDAAQVYEAAWNSSREAEIDSECFAMTSPSARLEDFDFDVLQQPSGQESLALPRLAKSMTVIFQKRANVKRVRVFRASAGTAALLRKCDGTLNVRAVCERLSTSSNHPSSLQSVLTKSVAALNALRESGLIRLVDEQREFESRIAQSSGQRD